MKFCKKFFGTFLSHGRGSHENFCLDIAPSLINLSITNDNLPLSKVAVKELPYLNVFGNDYNTPARVPPKALRPTRQLPL